MAIDFESEKPYWVAVSSVAGIGSSRFHALYSGFGSMEKVWAADESELKDYLPSQVLIRFLKAREKIRPIDQYQKLCSLGVSVITFKDRNYPILLSQLAQKPPILFVKGELNSQRTIAVVGTRKPTAYGLEVTRKLCQELAAHQFTIVSGLAFGIDKQAHQSALESQGKTYAFIPGGIDQIYPKSHQSLAQNITQNGAVISIFSPGTQALKGNFAARNRIIAAISEGVLIIEGEQKSGTMLTAKETILQSKPLFAVPGPITSRFSKGPNQLLSQGGILVTSVDNILENLHAAHTNGSCDDQVINFDNDLEKQIFDLLEQCPDLDQLTRTLDCSISQLSSVMTMMELKGMISNEGNGIWRRNSSRE